LLLICSPTNTFRRLKTDAANYWMECRLIALARTSRFRITYEIFDGAKK